jgi:hypothetical protein
MAVVSDAMKTVYSFEYINNTVDFESLVCNEDSIILLDHLSGFDKNLDNKILSTIDNLAKKYNKVITIFYEQLLPDSVKNKYQNINIKFDLKKHVELNLCFYENYSPSQNFIEIDKFLCCFVGRVHVGRQFLSAILNKTSLWDNETCTKNFKFTWDHLDGNLNCYFDNTSYEKFATKFFIDRTSNFDEKIINRKFVSGDFIENLKILENSVKRSFVHVVAETMPESYLPFVTEKFLQSVVCKGLFVSYAQPNWHSTILSVHGFKLYDTVFDYSFDQERNPVTRLIKLIEMLSKFQNLKLHDWTDLIELERENIEYNYDHYYSRSYLKNLAKFA